MHIHAGLLVAVLFVVTTTLFLVDDFNNTGESITSLETKDSTMSKTVYLGPIKIDNSEITFTHKNYLGSHIAETDLTGELVSLTNYLPYGESDNSEGKDYTGKTKTSTGTVNLGAREYSPEIGRFMLPDPVMSIQASPYVYSGNNPFKFIDPDGRQMDIALYNPFNNPFVWTGGSVAVRIVSLAAAANPVGAIIVFAAVVSTISVQPPDYRDGIIGGPPPNIEWDHRFITPADNTAAGGEVMINPGTQIENVPLITPEFRQDWRDNIMSSGETFVDKIRLDQGDRVGLVLGDTIILGGDNFGVSNPGSVITGTLEMNDDSYVITIEIIANINNDGTLTLPMMKTLLRAAKAANEEGMNLEIRADKVMDKDLRDFLEDNGFEVTKDHGSFGDFSFKDYSKVFPAE